MRKNQQDSCFMITTILNFGVGSIRFEINRSSGSVCVAARGLTILPSKWVWFPSKQLARSGKTETESEYSAISIVVLYYESRCAWRKLHPRRSTYADSLQVTSLLPCCCYYALYSRRKKNYSVDSQNRQMHACAEKCIAHTADMAHRFVWTTN